MPRLLLLAMPVLTVKYALGAVLAIVNDQPVPTRETLLLCHRPGSEHQMTQQSLVAVFSCADALVHPPQRIPCAKGWTERLCSRDTTLMGSDGSPSSQ